MTTNDGKAGQSEAKTVHILPPDKICEHFTQLGDLIHWQTSMNMKTGETSVIPTLDKGSGRKRRQAVFFYCPICGKPTFEEIEPKAPAAPDFETLAASLYGVELDG
jgi:hypothetical protein